MWLVVPFVRCSLSLYVGLSSMVCTIFTTAAPYKTGTLSFYHVNCQRFSHTTHIRGESEKMRNPREIHKHTHKY